MQSPIKIIDAGFIFQNIYINYKNKLDQSQNPTTGTNTSFTKEHVYPTSFDF